MIRRGDDARHDTGHDTSGPTTDDALTRSEERLVVGTTSEQIGTARAVKHVDTESVSARVERGTEHAELDRQSVQDVEGDSGEVETLPDGSLSIPVFEEQLVISKRLVVRERVIIRKHTVYEEQVVSADLKRERLEVEADGDVVVQDEAGTASRPEGRPGS